MEKFVPKEKKSKKAKKQVHAQQRVTWAISPVTRKPKNPKAYIRKKVRRYEDDFFYAEPFLSVFLSSH